MSGPAAPGELTPAGERPARETVIDRPAGSHAEDASGAVERSAWRGRGWLAAAAVALVVYLPSLGGGFLYDDQHVVVDNRRIRDLREIGTVLRYEPSRPVLGLLWALNYAVAGLTPWPYHLVNVLLHAANAGLLFSLFLWMGRRAGRAHASGAALAGACLFAASPMAAETVAYVASRSTALATLFGLASLRLAVSALERPSARTLLGALGLFVLALGSKEEAASVPLLLLLLDAFFVAPHGAGLRARWRIHAPFLLLPLLGLLARRALTGAWLPAPALDPYRYLATQLAAYPLYALRWLVPLDPAFYRGHPAAAWPPDAATLIGIGVTAVLALVSFMGRRRWPALSLALLWLAAGLLPSSSIVPLKEMVVDHRAYLGGAGIVYALGGLLYRPGRGPALAALVGLLALRSLHYEWVLADPVRAWQDAVRRAPRSAEAYLGLGEAHAALGDVRAESSFRSAVSLEPGDARAWTNLGAFYLQIRRPAEAEWAMRGAARAAPQDSRIRDNLGMILLAQGREAEAVAQFEAALRGHPPLAQPRINLAELLARRGELARARALLEEAARMEIDPQDDDRLVRLMQRLPATP
jgi:Flp pilus assembly protein TadD